MGKKVGNLDFWDGGYSELRIWTWEKKLEIWIFGMGGILNFGFGLRKKVGNLDFWDGGGGILER